MILGYFLYFCFLSENIFLKCVFNVPLRSVTINKNYRHKWNTWRIDVLMEYIYMGIFMPQLRSYTYVQSLNTYIYLNHTFCLLLFVIDYSLVNQMNLI